MDINMLDVICTIIGMLVAGVISYIVMNKKVAAITEALATAKTFMTNYGDKVKAFDEDLYNSANSEIAYMQTALEDGKISLIEFFKIGLGFADFFKVLYNKFKTEGLGETVSDIVDAVSDTSTETTTTDTATATTVATDTVATTDATATATTTDTATKTE